MPVRVVLVLSWLPLLVAGCSSHPGLEPDARPVAPDSGTVDAALADVLFVDAAYAAPEAWYKLEETTGTVIADSSGHGHAGVLSGSATLGIAGVDGSAFHFSGGRVRVPVASSLDFISGGTIALWLRFASQPSVGTMVSRGTGAADSNVLTWTSCGNFAVAYTNETTSSVTSTASDCNAIPLDTWTHVAFVNDGVTLTLYQNGAPVRSTAGGALGALPNDLLIGVRENGSFALQADLDEVKWWTVTLSAEQVCADAARHWDGTACGP